MSCERCASRTVWPRSTRPDDGSSSPASRLTSVVLPDPLTPTSATRSPGPEAPGRAAQQHLLAERHARPRSRSSTLSPSRGGGEAQQLDRVARRRLVGDQRVGGLDAELRLGRARRRAAAQPGELLAQQLLAARPRSRRPGAGARRARARTRRSRPRTGGRRASATSHVARDDGVEEPPVVGDDHERPAPRGEVAREPVDALDVEVVRGLVEEEQLGMAEQELRERDAPPLAARQRRDRRVEALREAAERDAAEQPVEHVAEAGVGRPLVVGAPADELVADRARRRRARRPGRAARCRAPFARVSWPASGSSTPAMSRRSVDLPLPFAPTMPMRSPSAMPSVTSCRTVRAP